MPVPKNEIDKTNSIKVENDQVSEFENCLKIKMKILIYQTQMKILEI